MEKMNCDKSELVACPKCGEQGYLRIVKTAVEDYLVASVGECFVEAGDFLEITDSKFREIICDSCETHWDSEMQFIADYKAAVKQ
jgi:predicted nucleic-acid-binding Zn-ribbon protein